MVIFHSYVNIRRRLPEGINCRFSIAVFDCRKGIWWISIKTSIELVVSQLTLMAKKHAATATSALSILVHFDAILNAACVVNVKDFPVLHIVTGDAVNTNEAAVSWVWIWSGWSTDLYTLALRNAREPSMHIYAPIQSFAGDACLAHWREVTFVATCCRTSSI